MPSSNVEVVEIGIPGPPGAGVSAAEKATYVTTSGANVFTAVQEVRLTNANAFWVTTGAGSSRFVVDTSSNETEIRNGSALAGYSDAGTTETFRIDSATGNAQFDGVVTVSGGRLVGDIIRLTLPIIDGGGAAITTGVKADFMVPYNLSVSGWYMLADTTGSISIELWKDTYNNFPPTVADLVTGTTGTNNPRISSANKGTSTTLTGWTTTWALGDVIRMNVASAATITRATLVLLVTRT